MTESQDLTFEINLDQEEEFAGLETIESRYRSTLLTGEYSIDAYVPESLQGCLAGRMSYAKGHRRSTKPPEAVYSEDAGTICILRRFEAVHSHPCVKPDSKEDMYQVVPEGDIAATTVEDLVRKSFGSPGAYSNRAMNNGWAFGGYKEIVVKGPKSLQLLFRKIYAIPELSAFNAEAHKLCKTPDVNPWTSMYDKMCTRTLHYGSFGAIYDNNLIDMRSWEVEDDTSFRITRDVQRRYASDKWLGFVDPSYTVASTEAGNIRMLVHGCRLRAYTENTRKAVIRCLRAGVKSSTEDAYFHYSGMTVRITVDSIQAIAKTWKTAVIGMRHESPSIHYQTRTSASRTMHLVSVTSNTGCVMRPIWTYKETSGPTMCHSDIYSADQLWVDSIMFASVETMKLLDITIPNPQTNPEQYMSTMLLMMPYAMYNEPPRPILGVNALIQGICKPSLSGSSRIAPVHSYVPPVLTSLGRTLWSEMVKTEAYKQSELSMPGTPLVVAFVNSVGNYEDSVVLSKHAVESGWLDTNGMTIHPVEAGNAAVKVGGTVDESTKGWRCFGTYTITSEGHNRSKMRYAVGLTGPRHPDVGDKLATIHGQKFVISSIVDVDKMPTCIDIECPNKVFKPHILVASSSVHKRKTIGQLLEAFTLGNLYDVCTFSPLDVTNPVYIGVTEAHHTKVKELRAYMTDPDGKPYIKSNTAMEPLQVECNYGICNFMQLTHMTRDKQHFADSVPKGVSLPRMRMSGSSVRLGDMESIAMMAKGMNRCVNELSTTADLVKFECCCRCMRQAILCDCGLQLSTTGLEERSTQRTTITACTRKPVLVSDLCLAVSTLNLTDAYNSGGDSESPDSDPSEPANRRKTSNNVPASSYVYQL